MALEFISSYDSYDTNPQTGQPELYSNTVLYYDTLNGNRVQAVVQYYTLGYSDTIDLGYYWNPFTKSSSSVPITSRGGLSGGSSTQTSTYGPRNNDIGLDEGNYGAYTEGATPSKDVEQEKELDQNQDASLTASNNKTIELLKLIIRKWWFWLIIILLLAASITYWLVKKRNNKKGKVMPLNNGEMVKTILLNSKKKPK